jgi:hypothetical protein
VGESMPHLSGVTDPGFNMLRESDFNALLDSC